LLDLEAALRTCPGYSIAADEPVARAGIAPPRERKMILFPVAVFAFKTPAQSRYSFRRKIITISMD
jgi:hypothetical protein